MERQVTNLRMEVDSAHGKGEALQKSLEDLRRQLTAKESELTEAGKSQVVPKCSLLRVYKYLSCFAPS